jgi:hypothetical protein
VPDRLTAREHRELGSLVETLDLRRIRVYRPPDAGLSSWTRTVVLWLSRNRAVALGNYVFLPDRCASDLPVLAHELTHCAQYQAWGAVRYFGSGAVAQLRDLLHRKLGIGSSPYRYLIGKPFDAYGMEQQGQIVEDCFRGHPGARAISPFHPRREPS